MSDLNNRVNFLEGEVTILEILTAEVMRGMVAHQLIDADHLRRVIDDRIAAFYMRQHDDLIMGTASENYFKGAVQALEKVKEELAKDKE